MPSPTISCYAVELQCLRCKASSTFDLDAYTCLTCRPQANSGHGILDVRYDYQAAARQFLRGAAGRPDLFRYAALLPIAGDSVHLLPTGVTPLVPAPRLARRYGLKSLYLKDETRNPTRCLKDRATAIAVGMALSRGEPTLYCASAGNAAISLAGFCAHAGLGCHVFLPAEISATRLDWLRRYAATIHRSAGDYDQAVEDSECVGRMQGWYSRNSALNPFLVEGKKTAGFEVAEALEWRSPDFIVAPVGDGCTLSAIGKAFRELELIGRVDTIPRLVGVQAAAMSPMVRRFGGQPAGRPTGITGAASIAVGQPRNAERLLNELRASQGTMLAVEDQAIAQAATRLASEAGIIAEFSSAATLAGLARLAEAESLAGKEAVLVITGGRVD